MGKANIIIADAAEGLKEIPANSIDCCVTSPPYYGLRDYGCQGQIGLENSVDEYINKLLEVFGEVHRVLKNDGTLWIVIKDSYSGSGKGSAQYPENAMKYKQGTSKGMLGAKNTASVKPKEKGLKQKDLMGVPFILALKLRQKGWYWRQNIIWEKPNAMPESVKDRCTDSHEYILLFSKSKKYYFDYTSIMEPALTADRSFPRGSKGTFRKNQGRRTKSNDLDFGKPLLRRCRSVWKISTSGYKSDSGAHYAVFPSGLAKKCILAGCREDGTVLDPFIGSGTVAEVALKNGRNCVGIEINESYKSIIEERINRGKANEIDIDINKTEVV